MDRFSVLFHVNEPEKWPVVLLNAMNFLKDVGQGEAEVEVVANGGAVSVYGRAAGAGQGNDQLLERMQDLSGLGVKFAACRNALNMHDIDEGSLPPFVTTVPAGITEIVKKQALGYAYIKP